jgi:hypothetical protein
MKTRILLLLAAVALTACDSNAPDPIVLSEAQAMDMMDALGAAGAFDVGTELSLASRSNAAALRAADAVMAAAVTSTINATAPCPNGGTAGVSGTATVNDDETQANAQITQTFSNCKSTSSEGTLWTFNGAPSIVTTLAATSNPATGAFTLSLTQKGALDVVGPDASGRCVIDLSLDVAGNENDDTGSITLNGSVCGVTFEQTVISN